MKWQGIKLKKLSIQKKITHQKLADLVGVTRQTINDWINGQIPKGNHLLLLCKVFKVRPDFFFLDNTEEYIRVPVHRTRKGAKITSGMQNDAILLSKEYLNIFRNYKRPNVVPVIRSHERNIDDANKISIKLRAISGVAGDKPIDYEHTFELAENLGINLIFRYFPINIKGYAFYTKIHNHRIVFVNNQTNIIDLIFPLLHEFIHAIRDDIEFNIVYEDKEERFCDNVANFIQFPQSYAEMVYEAVRGLKAAQQVNVLKGYARSNSHSLHGIVKAIKMINPSFNLNVGGADTNLKKQFPTLGDILFSGDNPKRYVQRLKNLSNNFFYVLCEQIDYISNRKLADLLGLESVLDAKEVKSEIRNVFTI